MPWIQEGGKACQARVAHCWTWKNGGWASTETTGGGKPRRSVEKKAEEEAAKAAVEPSTRASSSKEGVPAASSGTRKPSETPAELRLLLHEKIRADPKIYITRDASSYGYRAYYPSSFVEFQHRTLILVYPLGSLTRKFLTSNTEVSWTLFFRLWFRNVTGKFLI